MALKITIIGKVHDVGYRIFLLEEADRLFISRFDARNVRLDGKEALVVLIDGDKEQLDEFIRFVNSERPEGADVEEIRIEEYAGKIRDIENFRTSFNTAQLSKIVRVGLRMLGKQDETIDVIRTESEKTREELGTKIDLTREEIGGKLDLLRSDLKEYIEVNFKKLTDEMGEVKRELERVKKALRNAGISV
ncbi:acylphosphatase [Archaeoglobales archaeon]|nr:MAG: acylphosphatase [Archaeoglobales archaeon]